MRTCKMSQSAFRTRRIRAFLHRHETDTVHPLHVGLWRDHAYKFFGGDTESLSTLKLDRLSSTGSRPDSSSPVSSSSSSPVSSSSSSFFVTAILVDSLEFVTTEDRLELLCSDRFLSHYGLRDAAAVAVRPVVTFPLRHLSLTSTDKVALRWLKTVVDRGDLRAALCIGGLASRRFIARKGDVLPLPSKSSVFVNDPEFDPEFLNGVIVSDCGPINQGQIAVDTKIVVVRKEEGDGSFTTARRQPFENNVVGVVDEGLSEGKSPTSIVVCPRIMKSEADFRRRLRYVKDEVKGSPLFQFCDDLRIVFVSTKAARMLLDKKVKPNSLNGWILVSVEREEGGKSDFSSFRKTSPSSKEYALCNLIVLDEDDDDGNVDIPSAWISPSLAFNLNKRLSSGLRDGKNIRMKLEIPSPEVVDPFVNARETPLRSPVLPPYAIEVHISAIATPTMITQGGNPRLYRDAFRQYFERPRIVCQGDTICLDVSTDPDYFTNSSTNNGVNNNNNNNNNSMKSSQFLQKQPWMFYKVVKVKSQVDGVRFCLVDSHHTSLIQAGIVNDSVPLSMSRWFGGGRGAGAGGALDEFQGLMDDDEVFSTCYFRKLSNQLKRLMTPALEENDNSGVSSTEKTCPEDGISRILITGPKGVGKASLIDKVASDCHLNSWPIDCVHLAAETLAATEAKLKNVFAKALDAVPCILVLKNVHYLAKDPDGGGGGEPRVAAALKRIVASTSEALRRFPLILIGTTHNDTLVDPQIHDIFLHRIPMRPPSMAERRGILTRLFRTDEVFSQNRIDPLRLSQQTAGFLMGDLLALSTAARQEACDRVLSVFHQSLRNTSKEDSSANNDSLEDSFHSWRLQEDLVAAGFDVTSEDVSNAVESSHLSRGGGRFSSNGGQGIGGIPAVHWDDIGGFEGAKRKIRDTLSLPLSRPDLFSPRASCSGILLHGPPGTGKTLFAKAIATELALNFVSIKGPELLDMYVGQSEANIRRVFQDARDASPCVIFFDELDALVPNRGFSGDAGGVMDRVVSQMCGELDGLNLIDGGGGCLQGLSNKENKPQTDESDAAIVFVIGATNRPDLIDSALLRPGRLEKQIYLGPAEDPDDALAIFKAVTKDFHLHKNCSIEAVARMSPIGLTGAEIADLCSEAMTKALERKVRYVERKREVDPDFRIGEDESEIVVDESDFVHALSLSYGMPY